MNAKAIKNLKAMLAHLGLDTLENMKGDLLAAMDSGIEDQAEYDTVEATYNVVKQLLAGN